MEVAGRTFLISGAASGLGAACARRLASAGGNVILADVNVEQGTRLAGDLGARAIFQQTDVCDEASVAAAVNAGVKCFGSLSGAITCAGILGAGRVVGKDGPHDLALFTRVIQVNLIGTFNVLRLAAAAMAKNEPNAEGERGVLVTTASIAATDGQIGQAAYSASKGGVAAMTLPIARELARVGIRIVSIAPGVFETPMVAALTEEARASLSAQVPFPSRLGRPDEYAALAQHILENVMLNGTMIRLDGAIRMAAK